MYLCRTFLCPFYTTFASPKVPTISPCHNLRLHPCKNARCFSRSVVRPQRCYLFCSRLCVSLLESMDHCSVSVDFLYASCIFSVVCLYDLCNMSRSEGKEKKRKVQPDKACRTLSRKEGEDDAGSSTKCNTSKHWTDSEIACCEKNVKMMRT